MASQRSSMGVRFHRAQRVHTTQSHPCRGSYANLRPTRNVGKKWLAPRSALQKRHDVYTQASWPITTNAASFQWPKTQESSSWTVERTKCRGGVNSLVR